MPTVRATLGASPFFGGGAGLGSLLHSTIVWAGSAAGLHYLMAQAIATLLVLYLTGHLNCHWRFA
ncbi:MAG TPA: hypothetical protein DCP03_06895 [Polaromonas sp.]|nr:hypothetical protein [Polaromonas sp.]